jgi:hypothetical protein
MLLFLSFLGCPSSQEDTYQEPESIRARLHLLSAINMSNQSEVPTYSTFENIETSTEEDGKVDLKVALSSPYQIHARNSLTMNHVYQGKTGEEDFEFIGHLIDRATLESIYANLNFDFETGKGLVIASLNYSDWTPVYGASVGDNPTTSFILAAQSRPELGNALYEGDSPLVFFPNIEAGFWATDITPPQDVSCYSFPGGVNLNDVLVEVFADTISVVVFQCQ